MTPAPESGVHLIAAKGLSEDEWLTLSRRRSELVRVLSRWRSRLEKFAPHIAVEDLAQVALFKIWRYRDTFDEERASAWGLLVLIAHQEACMQIRRHSKRRSSMIVDENTLAGLDYDLDEQLDARRTLATIADPEHAAFVASYKRRARKQAATLAAKQAVAAPYGFRRVDGELEPDAAEQAVMSTARELLDAGQSLRAVVRELARRGVVARTGRPFSRPVLTQLVSTEVAA